MQQAALFNGMPPIPELSATDDFGASFKMFTAVRHALHGQRTSGPVTIMGRLDFVRHVALHLPDVSARIAEDDFGILHLEMGAMKLATRDAIRGYDFHAVRRHFAFIAYLYEHADSALFGAITVSYLEALFMDEAAAEFKSARSLLPSNLDEALRRAELRHNLLGNVWLQVPRARARDPISLTLE